MIAWTLDVRGDTTYVLADGEPVGMVQPDTYNPQTGRWTSWRRTGNPFDANCGWEIDGYHSSRERALAAVGWIEVAA